MNPLGLVFLAAGLFTVVGAFSQWDFFWENRRARALSALITRAGARALYTVLGLTLLLIGALTLFGVIEMRPR